MMGEMKPLSNEELDRLEATVGTDWCDVSNDDLRALIAQARRTPPTTQGEKPSGSCSASPGVGENVPSEALEPVREAMAALDRVETECPVRRASSSIEVCPACRATSSDGCAKAAVAGNRVIEAARTALSAAPPAPASDRVGEGVEPLEAVLEIALERKRQVEQEGWSRAHDDELDDGSLAAAAACYAAGSQTLIRGEDWPKGRVWPRGWEFNPSDRRRELIKAGALVVAEIERLDRAELAAGDGSPAATVKGGAS